MGKGTLISAELAKGGNLRILMQFGRIPNSISKLEARHLGFQGRQGSGCLGYRAVVNQRLSTFSALAEGPMVSGVVIQNQLLDSAQSILAEADGFALETPPARRMDSETQPNCCHEKGMGWAADTPPRITGQAQPMRCPRHGVRELILLDQCSLNHLGIGANQPLMRRVSRRALH
eukprot:1306666-Amphidinium_carterae.3